MWALRRPAQFRAAAMRLHPSIFAVLVCVHHTRAAAIALPDNKFDLDNVDLEDEPAKDDNLRTNNEVIPVKVIEDTVIDENSNDYVPPYDTIVNVKRIEVDLNNPGPPQRQEHETQNPENFSENDKIMVAIKHAVEEAQNAFNEGIKSVSNSFKTFLQSNEDLPAIQKNIKNLKETFSGQIEKLNETIRTYLKPETASAGESATNPKLEMVQARLKYIDNNFQLGIDTLTEGVEVYSIIKEEDEAEKAIALKADVKAEPEASPGDVADSSAPVKPVEKPDPANAAPANPAPANPAPANNQPPASTPMFPWTQFLNNFQNFVSNSLGNLAPAISNVPNGNNANGQNSGETQPSNPFVNFFYGIPLSNIFQGGQAQSPAGQAPASQEKPSKPPNTQADSAPAPAPAPPAPWSPQAIIQSVQTSWNNLINPGQNNQQPQQQNPPQPPPANTNPIQQAFQNIMSIVTPQQPQAQQPLNTANPSPPVAAVAPVAPAAPAVPAKAPESAPTKPEAAESVQGSNVVPAPVNEQPQEQSNQANPAPAQAGPIQQLVQNNPIIKGLQNAVQRIQGTPNPETPREEEIQEIKNKDEVEDPKGHFHVGHDPEDVNNKGDTGDSGRLEDKAKEEKVPNASSEEKGVLEEQLKPEELKTPVDEKTE